MRYSKDNLVKIIKKILGEPLFAAWMVSRVELPEMLNASIIRIWTEKISITDEEENILRRAFNQIKHIGHFVFDDEMGDLINVM